MEEKNMNELLKKAEVLIEALPYIQRLTVRSSLSNTAEVPWWTRN